MRTPTAVSPQATTLDRATGLIGMDLSLEAVAGLDTAHSHRTYAALNRTGMTLPQNVPFTSSLVSEGVALLEEILEFSVVNTKTMNDWQADHPGCVTGSVIGKGAWSAVDHTFKQLGLEHSRGSLRYMSQAIFEQTSRPLVYPATAVNNGIERMLSTDMVRWDTVGLYCAVTGHYLSSGQRTPPGLTSSQRAGLARKAYFAAMQCETFCNRMDQITDLNLWLLAEAGMLATVSRYTIRASVDLLLILFRCRKWCFGDDSYQAWRAVNNLSTAVFALGYHKGAQTQRSTPLYVIELRKRIIGLIHEHDKEFATFVGRPPRLSRHYCVVELPLDLPESALLGSDEEFEAAKLRLDQNGWSQDGSVHLASRHRTSLLLATLREEVLELTLGPELPGLSEKAK